MANSEDYLDGLLQSITDAKTASINAANSEELARARRVAARNRIKSNDDFMAATGIGDFKPTPVKRDNLQRALTEADFLKDFENELLYGDADQFIADFEREIDEEEQAYAEGRTPENDSNVVLSKLLGEEFYPESYEESDLSEDNSETMDATDQFEESTNQSVESVDQSEESEEESELDISDLFDSFSESEDEAADNAIEDEEIVLGDSSEEVFTEDDASDTVENLSVGDILSEAMQAMGDDDLTISPSSISSDDSVQDLLQAEFKEDSFDTEDGLSLEDSGFDSDESDTGFDIDSMMDDLGLDMDSLALEEPGLMDENDENADLMDLLGSEGELSDIGDLLSADENELELPEAREEFEGAAESVTSEDETASEGKKLGFFAKIKALFAGLMSKEDDETLDLSKEGQQDNLAEESENILAEFENEEAVDEKEAKKAAKKAEKEEKKKQKEAEKKEKDAEKSEKKKVKDADKEAKKAAKAEAKANDKTPKVPIQVILIFIILGVSFVALVLIFTDFVGYKKDIKSAKAAYGNGNYIEAYNEMNGMDLKEDDIVMYQQVSLLAVLEQKKTSFQIFMQMNKYDLALDQLLIAYGTYQDHIDEAGALGIGDSYNALGNEIADLLMSQFNVTTTEAYELYSLDDRATYTRCVHNILGRLGISIN